MIGLRTIVGLCLLCALGFSAIAASGAAASNGTTGFTCKEKKEPGGAGFSKAHCSAADAVATGAKYEHVAFAENTSTAVKGTNLNTAGEQTLVKLPTVVSGITVELQAKGWEGSGAMVNVKNPKTGEHYVQEEGTVTFKEVTVAIPAGKGCKVKTGQVSTNSLAVTSAGQGMALHFTPKEGSTFATLELEGCSGSKALEALNGVCEVTGSLSGHPDGAAVTFTAAEVTSEGTLGFRGQKAGLDGTVTISGKDVAAGDTNFTPLSITTVETP